MKIYNVKPSESTIKWTSNIGDREIHGIMHPHGGKLISELDQIVEGNIEIDLNTITVTDSALTEDERKTLQETLKSTPLTNGENAIINYQIEKVVPNADHDLIKGILQISKMVFGIDVIARFETKKNDLLAKGKIQVHRSNPVLIDELDHLYDEYLEENRSLKSFNIECDLVATCTDN